MRLDFAQVASHVSLNPPDSEAITRSHPPCNCLLQLQSTLRKISSDPRQTFYSVSLFIATALSNRIRLDHFRYGSGFIRRDCSMQISVRTETQAHHSRLQLLLDRRVHGLHLGGAKIFHPWSTCSRPSTASSPQSKGHFKILGGRQKPKPKDRRKKSPHQPPWSLAHPAGSDRRPHNILAAPLPRPFRHDGGKESLPRTEGRRDHGNSCAETQTRRPRTMPGHRPQTRWVAERCLAPFGHRTAVSFRDLTPPRERQLAHNARPQEKSAD